MARDFPGTVGNTIVVPFDSDLFPDPFSVFCRVKPDALGADVFGRWTPGILLTVNSVTGLVALNIITLPGSVGRSILSDVGIDTTAWHAIGASYSGGADDWLRVYVNGTLKQSNIATDSLVHGSLATGLGSRQDDTGRLDGKLADVALYFGKLTEEHWDALSTGVHPELVRPKELIGFWPLYGEHSPERDLGKFLVHATVNGTVPAADHASRSMCPASRLAIPA